MVHHSNGEDVETTPNYSPCESPAHLLMENFTPQLTLQKADKLTSLTLLEEEEDPLWGTLAVPFGEAGVETWEHSTSSRMSGWDLELPISVLSFCEKGFKFAPSWFCDTLT